MKTETETQTIETPAIIETPKTATAKKTRKPKPATVTEIVSQKIIGQSIPKSLFTIFPETETLFNRLSSYGFNRFKFDFGYSTKTTGKRNIVIEYRFFSIPNPIPSKRKSPPDGLYASANHQITGKTYFRLFPEIKSLFSRLEKTFSANNFRLNISFASVTSPQKIREHIIKTDAPETYLP